MQLFEGDLNYLCSHLKKTDDKMVLINPKYQPHENSGQKPEANDSENPESPIESPHDEPEIVGE